MEHGRGKERRHLCDRETVNLDWTLRFQTSFALTGEKEDYEGDNRAPAPDLTCIEVHLVPCHPDNFLGYSCQAQKHGIEVLCQQSLRGRRAEVER